MTAQQIASAARKAALELSCIGTVEQDRIAAAFEKFAELLLREAVVEDLRP